MDINYDPDVNLNQISEEAERLKDHDKRRYNRRHARLWTIQDYIEHQRRKAKQSDMFTGTQYDKISKISEYLNSSYQPDRHYSELGDGQALPTKGCLVHSEYTQYAHFLKLADMFAYVEKVRFYTDYEAGIEKAFNLAFGQRVLQGSADAFIVRADKSLKVDEKLNLTKASEKMILEIMLKKV